MRIAWIVYGALDQATGGYLYDRLVIERLRAAGDEIDVLSLDPRPRSRIGAAVDLARRIARMGPEVVVGDELCHRELSPAFALLPRRIARVLLVHHLRAWELDPGPRRALVTLNERAAIRLSDACVATSVTTAARLRREEGAARVEVARPGADRLPLRPRRPARDGRLRLLSVAAWIPRKRLLELLGAFERASAGAELHLIGDPGRDRAYAARVRAAIAGSAFLRGRVAPRGVVGDEALADALAEADALVAASSLEGYGMALAEAIRAGVPVISTRGGAVAEVVQDGAEALLCDGPGDLEAALARFLGDAALRRRMRAAAEARAPALPTWDEAAAALRAAAGRFVGGRPAL